MVAWLVQELLVNVQEAENGYDSMWHRDADNDQAMFTEHFAMVRIKMLTLVRNSARLLAIISYLTGWAKLMALPS